MEPQLDPALPRGFRIHLYPLEQRAAASDCTRHLMSLDLHSPKLHRFHHEDQPCHQGTTACNPSAIPKTRSSYSLDAAARQSSLRDYNILFLCRGPRALPGGTCTEDRTSMLRPRPGTSKSHEPCESHHHPDDYPLEYQDSSLFRPLLTSCSAIRPQCRMLEGML